MCLSRGREMTFESIGPTSTLEYYSETYRSYFLETVLRRVPTDFCFWAAGGSSLGANPSSTSVAWGTSLFSTLGLVMA